MFVFCLRCCLIVLRRLQVFRDRFGLRLEPIAFKTFFGGGCWLKERKIVLHSTLITAEISVQEFVKNNRSYRYLFYLKK